ncbi:MAG TPA: hypothetical protein VGI54_12145, partial [Solirubrobacteraceae bacterium]
MSFDVSEIDHDDAPPPDDGGHVGGPPVADAAPAEASPNGVTPPARRGGSGRFLTDVLIDLGYAPRERVEAAV